MSKNDFVQQFDLSRRIRFLCTRLMASGYLKDKVTVRLVSLQLDYEITLEQKFACRFVKNGNYFKLDLL